MEESPLPSVIAPVALIFSSVLSALTERHHEMAKNSPMIHPNARLMTGTSMAGWQAPYCTHAAAISISFYNRLKHEHGSPTGTRGCIDTLQPLVRRAPRAQGARLTQLWIRYLSFFIELRHAQIAPRWLETRIGARSSGTSVHA